MGGLGLKACAASCQPRPGKSCSAPAASLFSLPHARGSCATDRQRGGGGGPGKQLSEPRGTMESPEGELRPCPCKVSCRTFATAPSHPAAEKIPEPRLLHRALTPEPYRQPPLRLRSLRFFFSGSRTACGESAAAYGLWEDPGGRRGSLRGFQGNVNGSIIMCVNTIVCFLFYIFFLINHILSCTVLFIVMAGNGAGVRRMANVTIPLLGSPVHGDGEQVCKLSLLTHNRLPMGNGGGSGAAG